MRPPIDDYRCGAFIAVAAGLGVLLGVFVYLVVT